MGLFASGKSKIDPAWRRVLGRTYAGEAELAAARAELEELTRTLLAKGQRQLVTEALATVARRRNQPQVSASPNVVIPQMDTFRYVSRLLEMSRELGHVPAGIQKDDRKSVLSILERDRREAAYFREYAETFDLDAEVVPTDVTIESDPTWQVKLAESVDVAVISCEERPAASEIDVKNLTRVSRIIVSTHGADARAELERLLAGAQPRAEAAARWTATCDAVLGSAIVQGVEEG